MTPSFWKGVGRVGSAVGGIAKAGWNTGVIGRSAIGGAIGAATGYLRSDSDSISGKDSSALRGAVAGIGLGLATGAPKALGFASKTGLLNKGAKMGLKSAGGIGKMALGAAYFAAENPLTTAAIAGAGIWAANDTSPYYSMGTDDSTVLRQTMNGADMQVSRMEGSPIQSAQSLQRSRGQTAFANSTTGLVQGLFRRRH